MKTVILYASKKGTTEDCAKLIQNQFKADIINLKDNNNPEIEKYDLVIIGTPLYVGKPIDVVSQYCTNKEEVLKTKNIAFFLCGIGEGNQMIESFKTTMPNSLIDNALTINHFGGEFRENKCNFFEKIILKQIIKKENLDPKINEKEIDLFVSKLKEVLK